jgi:hypothetical protein
MKVIDWLGAYSSHYFKYTKILSSPRRKGERGEVPKYITVLL